MRSPTALPNSAIQGAASAPLSPVAPSPQGTTPAPGSPVGTPAPAEGPALGVFTQVPRTAAEVSSLRSQRSELSRQLTSATGRREELAEELEKATSAANRAGIEARLRLLDERILQIERDISTTGQLLARTPGSIAVPPPPPPGSRDFNMDLTPIVAILSTFVFAPIAIAYAVRIWKRSDAKVESALERDNAERLRRLESAVDSIAIEMERVSEGQRFVTKLLAETQGRDHARLENKK
ncbi:MAG: hypothetical protein IT357_01305 [Gemmatimonadaceae bacterium]|nr:hypothetical protein [Gemmatimonadaceae bacterium]